MGTVKILFFAVSISLTFFISPSNTVENNATRRQSRIFPWGFGVVRFENGICSAGENLQGTCYSRRQCREVDGVGTTQCAKGIGVCCVIQRTCGETSSLNNTYFVSPKFPNAYTGGTQCTLTIKKCNPDICQIRIDFLSLTLSQPNTDGICNNDALYVIGGAAPVPIICGDNSGQHIYVDFNRDADIQIVINTAFGGSLSRSWNIKVSQIGCDCPTRAPTGCLMYYREQTGTIKSFNYGTTVAGNGTRQLANQNYGVCVEMKPGYCGIRYSATNGNSFTLSGDSTDPMDTMTCMTDFIVVPDPINADSTPANTDRFCGNTFGPITTYSKPFVMTVVTNGNEMGDVANRGFSINYAQQRCTNMAVVGRK